MLDQPRVVTLCTSLALAAIVGTTMLATAGCSVKGSAGARSSGQSSLMDETFAGQNACDPEDHTRPFIIEWDATDMSSFESHAANDIVIVKYENCKLRVLDECRNDSIRGSQGAYKAPEWTSGSLETIDIHNEGELYAKLPLGKATLGGRVQAGESFHMEYFVAGTTNATRDAVYGEDLASNPGCDGATHFVYGYNLGAFALGSANNLDAELGGSAFGFGAGGSRSSGRNAEKKGGDLSTCSAADATEVMGCKTPIRLNLRPIRDGANPEVAAMAKPDTDASLSAAGTINEKLERNEDAMAHYDAAIQKAGASDGKGCVKELDLHDDLDPTHKSTDPKSPHALLRAQCIMLSGQCEAGKTLVRKTQENGAVPQPPEQIDRFAEAYAMLHCQGDSMSDRDKLLQSFSLLQRGASSTRETVEFCEQHWKRAFPLLAKVKPKDSDDHAIIRMPKLVWMEATACMGRAGDCERAWEIWNEGMPKDIREHITGPSFTPESSEAQSRDLYYGEAKDCRPK
jgi:hypothetical protein